MTVAEVVARNNHSNAQAAVYSLIECSGTNLMQLNADKCKELVIDFKTHKHSFDPLYISSNSLRVVSSPKVLGLTISDDLSWNLHVSDIIRKANKRLYFLILLRRAGVPSSDIICFHCTCIRPLLEYCAPVFHHAIPKYLSNDLERFRNVPYTLLLQVIATERILHTMV